MNDLSECHEAPMMIWASSDTPYYVCMDCGQPCCPVEEEAADGGKVSRGFRTPVLSRSRGTDE